MCSCSFNSCLLHSLYGSEVCDIHWSWSSFLLHLSWFVTVPDAECRVLEWGCFISLPFLVSYNMN